MWRRGSGSVEVWYVFCKTCQGARPDACSAWQYPCTHRHPTAAECPELGVPVAVCSPTRPSEGMLLPRTVRGKGVRGHEGGVFSSPCGSPSPSRAKPGYSSWRAHPTTSSGREDAPGTPAPHPLPKTAGPLTVEASPRAAWAGTGE
ncbi:hypothetical protein B0T16DRAFT_398389 [Cercophora newfieldiana]|uniref:Uncharacterized protein n=1 Tax=Cercophora newfieldiana TaxID=92897 RepID=A0AA40CYF7_9PEZI|nr:hypothetical protein B0T16DRAFT_398389 [Cercophora newfieldiana]